MKRIWTKLDPEGRHVLCCFVTVLALTLFARGFAGSAQAQVTVTRPQERTMTGEFYVPGTLTPLGTKQYLIPNGVVVDKTAEVGTELEAGDVVLLVEPEALEELMTRKGAEVKKLELQIEGLLDHAEPSEDALNAAKEAVSDAKALRKERKAALADAQEALAMAAEEEQAAAEAAVEEAEQLLAEAEDALSAAKKQQEREENALAEAETQARRTREANEAEASILKLDLDRASAELEQLEAIRDAGYAVTAPAAGTLADVDPSGSFYAMTDPYGGNLLTFRLEEQDAALMTPQTKVTISREEQTAELYGCTSENDRTTFTKQVVKAGWEPGSVMVHGVLWEEEYRSCVPVTALRRDGNGYFLYVLERKPGLWGIEQTVRRVYVLVERSDGAYAAVSGLEPGYEVVVTSSKPLTEGCRVRVTP